MQRKFRIKTWFLILLVALFALVFTVGVQSGSFFPRQVPPDRTPPQVQIWYGAHQTFGQGGLSQRWVNVLGNASDPQSHIRSLSYRLNGGPAQNLSTGPDERRLNAPGDFNVVIDPGQLKESNNTLLIEAVNGSGLKTDSTVTLAYHPRAIPLPYRIDWAHAANAQDVLQIVDGKWRWDSSGIRPVELGYDRFLTIGDQSWQNYQVTVAVTFHGFSSAAFQQKTGGNHSGVSIDLRWLGHSDYPARCAQPLCGWDPVGDFNKYFIMPDGQNFLGLKVKENETGFPQVPYHLEPGHSYIFKASVQTTPGGNLYRFKVWEPAAGPEPAGWMMESLGVPGPPPIGNPDHGAFALVAHHSDVTFGNILVEPLP